jgi:GNAT superfamily N-acetyltransferase
VTGEIVVGEAQPSDARVIAEGARGLTPVGLSRSSDGGGLERPSMEQTTTDFAQGLAELPRGSAVFVAQRAGRVAGYVFVLPSPDPDVPTGTSELGSLYVTEDVAGTGVARALMEAAVEHACAAGHDLLTSWVRRENGRARRFYEKCGLQPDGGERSGPHEILPIEIDEIRYRTSLRSREARPRG